MARRPEELTYAVDERPPWPRLLALGLQHAVLVSIYLVLVVIVARAAGAPEPEILDLLSLSMIAIGIAGALQALPRGPVGSGYLAVPVYSAIYLGPAVLAAKAGGLPAVLGMTIFAGLVETALSFVLRRLRSLFPPAVSGFIVAIVGVELGLVGMRQTLAIAGSAEPMADRLVALLTLGTSIALSVWGGGVLRLVCSLIGLAAGFAAALAFGILPAASLALMGATPWLALPDPGFLGYAFDPALAPSFAAAGIAATLRTIGVITTCQKLNDADWKRPDLASIRRGTLADGLGCVLAGLIGGVGLNTGPSLVGVSSATRATSRSIAFASGAILVVLAFVPKVAAFFLVLPLPVAGGMLVFTACFMIAGGIQIMTSRNMDARSTYVVGIAFLLAMSKEVFPGYFERLPPALHALTGSMLSLGVLAAVGLTLLFRLGIRRTSVMLFSESDDSLARLEAFLGSQGKAWKLAPDVVERSLSSTRQAIDQLRAANLAGKLLEIRVSYDEVDLAVELRYRGTLLVVPGLSVRRRTLVEEESFAFGLANYLSGVHPDRLDSFTDGDQAVLRMRFAA
ncbi:MAG: solute carrier family 23 protein [Dongiaceae bacterium]